MCGITGIINFSDNLDTFEARLSNRRMSNSIIHRGPDDEGTFESLNCTMSNRRLSIVDIQNGHQPIKSENGRYAMVYNGECYNYLELKQKLIQKDINFKTNSDTEVIFNGLNSSVLFDWADGLKDPAIEIGGEGLRSISKSQLARHFVGLKKGIVRVMSEKGVTTHDLSKHDVTKIDETLYSYMVFQSKTLISLPMGMVFMIGNKM